MQSLARDILHLRKFMRMSDCLGTGYLIEVLVGTVDCRLVSSKVIDFVLSVRNANDGGKHIFLNLFYIFETMMSVYFCDALSINMSYLCKEMKKVDIKIQRSRESQI